MEYETIYGMIEIDFDQIEEADPDSGIYEPYVTDWWVSHVGGKRCSAKVSDWLIQRLDCEFIENEIVERFY